MDTKTRMDRQLNELTNGRMDEWTGIQMDRLMDYGAPDGGGKMDEWLSRWTDEERQSLINGWIDR